MSRISLIMSFSLDLVRRYELLSSNRIKDEVSGFYDGAPSSVPVVVASISI